MNIDTTSIRLRAARVFACLACGLLAGPWGGGFHAVAYAAEDDAKPAGPEVRELDHADVHLAIPPGDVKKPRVVESAEELAKVVTNEAARKKLSAGLDFTKERLFVFSWQGSGQDSLSASIAPSKDDEKESVIHFRLRRGLTRDLRPHVKIFAGPAGLPWKVAD